MKNGSDGRTLIFVALIWSAAAITSFPHVSRAEGAIKRKSGDRETALRKTMHGLPFARQKQGRAAPARRVRPKIRYRRGVQLLG